MKFTKFLLPCIGILFLAHVVSAQQSNPPAKANKEAANHQAPMIPNLSEDQKAKIKEIRMKEKRENLTLKNKSKEIEAHLNTLTSADKPNMDEIHKTIDELVAVKGKMKKNKAESVQQIRSLLNDEQRLAFDLKKKEMKKKKGKKQAGAPRPPSPPKPAK